MASTDQVDREEAGKKKGEMEGNLPTECSHVDLFGFVQPLPSSYGPFVVLAAT